MKSQYWKKREDSLYLHAIRHTVNALGKGSQSIIDVGSNNCSYIDWFDWIPEKYSIDLRTPYEAKGVNSVKADFIKHEFDKPFDIVLCLQVIEHVPNAKTFCRKLLRTGKIVVVSVPYKWPAGRTKGHVHDPVGLLKMTRWFGRLPNYHTIIKEVATPSKRLICIYDTAGYSRWDRVPTKYAS